MKNTNSRMWLENKNKNVKSEFVLYILLLLTYCTELLIFLAICQTSLFMHVRPKGLKALKRKDIGVQLYVGNLFSAFL